MNKSLLKSFMAKYEDTQATLANALGLSLSRLNAKINTYAGAEFNQTEIQFIKERYALSPSDVDSLFFTSKVS